MTRPGFTSTTAGRVTWNATGIHIGKLAACPSEAPPPTVPEVCGCIDDIVPQYLELQTSNSYPGWDPEGVVCFRDPDTGFPDPFTREDLCPLLTNNTFIMQLISSPDNVCRWEAPDLIAHLCTYPSEDPVPQLLRYVVSASFQQEWNPFGGNAWYTAGISFFTELAENASGPWTDRQPAGAVQHGISQFPGEAAPFDCLRWDNTSLPFFSGTAGECRDSDGGGGFLPGGLENMEFLLSVSSGSRGLSLSAGDDLDGAFR